MRRSTLAIALLASTLFANAAHGQQPAEGFQHIEALEPFVGMWRADSDSGDDAGGFGMIARWASNKSYLQLQFTARPNDERMHFGTVLIGHDVATNKVTMWGFWPDQQSRGDVNVGENEMSWASKGDSARGETSADASLSISGGELTIAVTNARRGGEDRPDMTLVLKKRQRRRD